MKITYCQCTYSEHFNDTKRCVERVKPYINRIIIIHDDLSDDNISWLKNNGCEVFQHKWIDNFSLFRNYYIKEARNGDYIFATDPDEIPSEKLCENLKSITDFMTENEFNVAYVPVEDHWINENGEIGISRPDWQKPMIYMKSEKMRYFGNPHETMRMDNPLPINLKNTQWNDCVYIHEKEWWRSYRNGVRNDFISESNRESVRWIKLRRMCDKYGIKTWYQLKDRMISGDIPVEIRKWMIEGKDEMSSEWKDWFGWWRYLHPDFARDDIENFCKGK